MEESTSYNNFLALNQRLGGKKCLRDTKQRRLIFTTFMHHHQHITAEGLYNILRLELPQIGQATVYRTLKLLCDSGLARELNLLAQGSQGSHSQSSFFEPISPCEHHDHLVCTVCGKHFGFHNDEIEELQEKIAAENNFQLDSHSHVLYGKCHNCCSQTAT